MACVAAAACVVYSLPAAFAVGRARKAFNGGLLCMAAALLLCPPMVYVFGWDRAIPALIEPHIRCILVWALWAWPVPAAIIGRALARYRDEYHDAALLETSAWKSFGHVALPNLRSHIALVTVVLFVLFFNDYGVPHACGLNVYATDLLGRATSSSHPADTLLPALPSLGVTLVALATAGALWRRAPGFDRITSTETRAPAPTRTERSVVTAMFLVSWGIPIVSLVVKLSGTDLARALRTYWFDLLATLGVAAGGGAVVVLLAIGAWQVRWMRLSFLTGAVAWGVVPGALVGESLVAAYNTPTFNSVYGAWPILLLGYSARFAWIGLAVAASLHRRTDPCLLDQAATDGAGAGHRMRYVVVATHWPTLAAAAGLATILGVAELPVTAMIRPPGLAPIALVIVEKFHRFEDGLLIALSLMLVLLGLAGAAAWTWVIRRVGPD